MSLFGCFCCKPVFVIVVLSCVCHAGSVLCLCCVAFIVVTGLGDLRLRCELLFASVFLLFLCVLNFKVFLFLLSAVFFVL